MYKKQLQALFLSVSFIGLNCIYSFGQEKKEYLIVNFGAIGDGKTLNTEAIQKAIDFASENNGGKVIVPKGKYLTGTFEMKSNVELHLNENAILLGSTNPRHYASLEMKGRPESPKKDDNSQLALIVAYKADNISISGKGTIDGQGRALAINIDSLHHAGIVIDPDYSTLLNRPNEKMRPKLIRFSTCNTVNISKISCKNSACWGLSFELCNNLTLDSLTIYNRAYWNNDGMDITDSRNVRVTNCDVNSADDGICLKSYYPGFYNDSIYIANCTIRSGASAIKFGTASYGGFKNITINNIKVFDTFRSAVALESVDGGIIEDIKVSNVIAENTGNAIFIRLGYRGGEKPGIIRNIHITNMKVKVPFGRPDMDYDIRAMEYGHHNTIPSSITGIPEHYVQNVLLENIEITYPGRASKGQAYFPLSRLNQFPEKIKDYPEFSMFGELPAWGIYVRHATGIKMKNVLLKLEESDFRPALVFYDVKSIDLYKLKLPNNLNTQQIILKDFAEFKMIPKEDNQLRVIE
ncbi:glycoside hydrolase family 28 protein [Mariniflexile sp. HMF6888]|uniref:glycoside hydrolase family 28 protein n=1 Tax=Mariniflexile sp. HMF6888 TaxID=3373086 RepID=UPI0037B0FC8E